MTINPKRSLSVIIANLNSITDEFNVIDNIDYDLWQSNGTGYLIGRAYNNDHIPDTSFCLISADDIWINITDNKIYGFCLSDKVDVLKPNLIQMAINSVDDHIETNTRHVNKIKLELEHYETELVDLNITKSKLLQNDTTA